MNAYHPSNKRSSTKQYAWVLALLGLAGAVHASFLTGFETSSGYGTNATVIGVHDTSAGGTNTWQNVSGFSNSVTSSTVLPQTGLMSLRLLDTSTSAGTAASLDLGSAFNFAQPFTLSFSMAITATGGTAGLVFNVWLGNAVNSLSTKEWTHFAYDSSTQNVGVYVSNAAGTSTQLVTLGKYTDFATAGQYMTASISIDPTTRKYTNVTLSGALATTDVTSSVLAVNSGTIPWIPSTAGNPGSNFWVSSGGLGTVTAFIDNVSVIPEPGPAVLVGLGLVPVLGLVRRGVGRRA